MNIAVFCSGRGTNLQAIIEAAAQGRISGKIRLVLADRKEARALKLAEAAGIEAVFINPADFSDRELFDKECLKYLEKFSIDLVVLAGFMRILSPAFVRAYEGRMLNIHPALLPAFRGSRAIKEAWEYGVKVTGVTVHFVEDDYDSGPVILQEAVKVEKEDTLESLEEKIHKVEHKIYPRAIELFCRGKLKITGRKVKILGAILLLIALFSWPDLVLAEEGWPARKYSYLPAELSIERTKERQPEDKTQESQWDNFMSLEDEQKEEGWQPLTEEEVKQKKKELAYSSAKAAAEFFDSIYMPYMSRGLFNIIGTAYTIDEYQRDIKEKHGLSFDVDIDDLGINVKYERQY